MRAGHLRAVPDPVTAAWLMLESITWFARHRREDRDGAAIDDRVAEGTVVDFVVNSLTRSDDGSR